MSNSIWAVYFFHLAAIFPMINWALRENLAGLVFSEPLGTTGWFAVTYAILACSYTASVWLPSLWTAMTLTGIIVHLAVN